MNLLNSALSKIRVGVGLVLHHPVTVTLCLHSEIFYQRLLFKSRCTKEVPFDYCRRIASCVMPIVTNSLSLRGIRKRAANGRETMEGREARDRKPHCVN